MFQINLAANYLNFIVFIIIFNITIYLFPIKANKNIYSNSKIYN